MSSEYGWFAIDDDVDDDAALTPKGSGVSWACAVSGGDGYSTSVVLGCVGVGSGWPCGGDSYASSH